MRFVSRRSPSQHQMPKNGLCSMGVPFSNANRIRFIEESTLSRWPSSPSRWDSPQGVPPPPLSMANGIRFKGVPFSFSKGFPSPSGWDSPQGASLSTANGIRFKGFPFSTANGICIKWVTLSKRMGFAPRGSPSPKRMGFASRGSPSPKRMRFAPKGHPLQANGIRIKRVTLSKANGIRF